MNIEFDNIKKVNYIMKKYIPLSTFFKSKNDARKFLEEIQEQGYWGHISETRNFYKVDQILVPPLTTGYYTIIGNSNVDSYIKLAKKNSFYVNIISIQNETFRVYFSHYNRFAPTIIPKFYFDKKWKR